MTLNRVRACRFQLTKPVFFWAFVALLVELTVQWVPNHLLHRPFPRPLTLLPLIPVILFWLALGRAISRMDELQRRIWHESVFIAFMSTLILSFVLAGLQRAGLHPALGDDMGSSMMLLWGCAYIFCAWKYR